MKKIFFLIISISFFSQPNIFAQIKSYGTLTISRWTLEKFPKHYFVKAIKVRTEKDPISYKPAVWEEIDAYGQNNGLRVEIQSDGKSPATARYYYKGKCVYSAEYFSNSTKASYIRNLNLDGLQDGPQVERFSNYSGGIIEELKVFKNGEDINRDEKLYGFDNHINWVNGLIDGDFDFITPNFSYVKGTADSGEITFLQIRSFENVISDYEFNDNNVKLTVLQDVRDNVTGGIKDSVTIWQYELKTRIKITNCKKLKNTSNYFYCGNAFDRILQKVKDNMILKKRIK